MAELIQIGNSKGVRIPKVLIEQAGLEGTLELRVVEGGLLISPLRRPRQGWDKAVEAAVKRGATFDSAWLEAELDTLIEPDGSTLVDEA